MTVRLAAPMRLRKLPQVDCRLLRSRAVRLLRELGRSRSELSIALVDDKDIAALNIEHRGKNAPTDVLSFSLLEGSWAGDTCGAFFAFGFLGVAIRNAGTRAKVYLWNGSSFDLKSTSPLNAGVKVKALAVDHRDMTVVLCSNKGDTVMVVLSVYPYVEWFDITSNHPNGSPVFAAEIL